MTSLVTHTCTDSRLGVRRQLHDIHTYICRLRLHQCCCAAVRWYTNLIAIYRLSSVVCLPVCVYIKACQTSEPVDSMYSVVLLGKRMLCNFLKELRFSFSSCSRSSAYASGQRIRYTPLCDIEPPLTYRLCLKRVASHSRYLQTFSKRTQNGTPKAYDYFFFSKYL